MKNLLTFIGLLLSLNLSGQGFVNTGILIDNTFLNSEVTIGYNITKKNIIIGQLNAIPEVNFGIDAGMYTNTFSKNTNRAYITLDKINLFGRIYGEVALSTKLPIYMRIEVIPQKSTAVGAVFWRKRIDNIEAYGGALFDTSDNSRVVIGIKFNI